jgi:hypothetical protein
VYLGMCVGCGEQVMVNHSDGKAATLRRQAVVPGDYCAKCFEKLDLDSVLYPSGGTTELQEDTSPFQENAIKDMEEDTGYDEGEEELILP